MPDKWPFHPLADLFPMMDEAALAELAADIKAESQREPIYLWQDQIIDGRNRYEACKRAGVEPVFKKIDFPGGESEALAYVVSRNLKRRHLTTLQRSVIAAKVATLKRGGDHSANLPNAISQAKAAEMLNVSTRSVTTAKAVLKTGDAELVAAVESGEVSLHKAAETVRSAAEPEPNHAKPTAAVADKRRAEAAAQDSRYRQKEIRAKLQALTDDERRQFLVEAIGVDDIVAWGASASADDRLWLGEIVRAWA
jgi:ParB-like chromosome segregation protein Spo0J